MSRTGCTGPSPGHGGHPCSGCPWLATRPLSRTSAAAACRRRAAPGRQALRIQVAQVPPRHVGRERPHDPGCQPRVPARAVHRAQRCGQSHVEECAQVLDCEHGRRVHAPQYRSCQQCALGQHHLAQDLARRGEVHRTCGSLWQQPGVVPQPHDVVAGEGRARWGRGCASLGVAGTPGGPDLVMQEGPVQARRRQCLTAKAAQALGAWLDARGLQPPQRTLPRWPGAIEQGPLPDPA
jgi:hypothetical protein